MTNHWQERKVLVTGGASFIGPHLVDPLVVRGSRLRVVDSPSSGLFENIASQVETGRVDFQHDDLLDREIAARATQRIEVVFVPRLEGDEAELLPLLERPTRPLNRLADTRLARERLGWEPQVPFAMGLGPTMDWVFATKERQDVQGLLDGDGFMERAPVAPRQAAGASVPVKGPGH